MLNTTLVMLLSGALTYLSLGGFGGPPTPPAVAVDVIW